MILITNAWEDGKRLSKLLHSRFCFISEKIYPDSETKLWLSSVTVKERPVFYFVFSSQHPFDSQLFKLFSILQHLTPLKPIVILPYLPYCRSYPIAPKEINNLECILRTVGRLSSQLFLITPHISAEILSRYAKPARISIINVDNTIAQFIRDHFGNRVLLISPDQGFAKHIEDLARAVGSEFLVLSKKRISPTKVEYRFDQKAQQMIFSNRQKRFIIVDDIVSTGATLRKASALLRKSGARIVSCLVMHNTSRKSLGLKYIFSNSLLHTRYDIDIIPDIARAFHTSKF